MAHDVFISYASEDKTVADAVCAFLEGRKIRCWIAPRDVRPGVIYSEALIDALNSSRLLVLVFSSSSNNSPHVMREMEAVVSMGIPILPFRIEDIEPTKAIKYYIGSTHWLDALTPPLKKYLDYLADNVELLLRERMDTVAAGGEPAFDVPPIVPSVSTQLPKTPALQGLRNFIVSQKLSVKSAGIIVVVLLAIAGWAYALDVRMAANQAGQQQGTMSINGLSSAGNIPEPPSSQQSTQAGTQSPTSNQVSDSAGGASGSGSQNIQTGVSNPGQSAASTTTQVPAPDFKNIDESNNIMQQAHNLLMSSGDPQKILALCNQAIALNPNNDFAYETRGINYFYSLNQHSQGFADIQKAIEINPQKDYLYMHRGEMYADTGYKDLAINDYKKAFALATGQNDQDCINQVTPRLKALGVPGY